MAATNFALDAEQTQANLEQADQAGASQHGGAGGGVGVGGYMTALLAGISGGDSARGTASVTQATTNTASRQFSIATMQNTEASNAAVLTT